MVKVVRSAASAVRRSDEGPGDRVTRLRRTLGRRVDGSSLSVFRAGFGLIVAWEIWRAFEGNQFRADYAIPDFQFRWWLFEWVRPLPDVLLYGVFAFVGLAALCLALGVVYRVAAVVTCGGLAYWFLMEKASYLNHRYLATVMALLLIFITAKGEKVPSWSLWLLRFQVGVPYFFAGLAKLNADWLVRNEPLRMWLADQTDFPVIGRFLTEPLAVRSMAYAATALDLLAPFLLLHRRTRTAAYAAALGFHLLNTRLFDIGMFPWMMIVATTVFFEPDWPRRMLRAVRSGSGTVRGIIVAGALIGFCVGGFLPRTFVPFQAFGGAFGVAFLAFQLTDRRRPPTAAPSAGRPVTKVGLAVLAAWCAIQLIVPLRHYAIPGNTHWTEEGQRFSWHMLLDSKSGTVLFRVTDPVTGEMWPERPEQHVTRYQASKMRRSPDLIVTFAHHLERLYREAGYGDVEVRAITKVSLNGRPEQRLVDPKADLTKVRRPLIPPADWIVPLRD